MEVVYENVTKKFGEVVAVNNLNLRVEDREFLVLLGPSGGGKTTALRLVAGLETLDSGNIYIGDAIVNDLEPKDRNVAMVFQSYALYPTMKVYANLAFPLKAHKVPKEEIRRQVRKVAELLRISHLLDRRPRQLSGGEAQRVALGRAIVREPNVFLMDEPLSNLDAKLRVQMRAELQKLHRRLGITTIYVTHDQEEAMTIGQRIAILDNGVLQQAGSPEEVYERPANIFVAGFVGSPSMNMLEGNIIKKDGELAIDVDVFTYVLPKGLRDLVRKAAASEVVLGVRPESITIVKKKRPNTISAKVDVLEPIGRELHVQLAVGDKSFIAITDPDQDLSIEEKVWLLFDEKRLYIFDKKSGKLLV